MKRSCTSKGSASTRKIGSSFRGTTILIKDTNKMKFLGILTFLIVEDLLFVNKGTNARSINYRGYFLKYIVYLQ